MLHLAALLATVPVATVGRATTPIVVDGRLDEPAWDSAEVLDGFVGTRPVEGRVPSQATRVRLLRDEATLYIAFDALDTEPAAIRATLSDRDAMFSDDLVAIVLDPFRDARRAFVFLSNPLGVQGDCVNVEGGEGDDCTWDAVFSSAGAVGAQGYVVEIAIPFASVRFDPLRDEWGFSAVRIIPRSGEQLSFPERRAALGSPLRQLGALRGMSGIRSSGTLDVVPELTTRAGPPGASSSALVAERAGRESASGDVGVSAKLSRAGAAADIAWNPDFSQVESDARKIELNERFRLSYPEKRPFFLEGRELLVSPWTVVYTRSIVDPLYGAKVSGKSDGTAYAILHAVDESPAGSVMAGEERWTPETYGGQNAVCTLARVSTDLTPGAGLGLLVTDKHIGDGWNRVGGIDGSLQASESVRLASQVLWSATDHPGGDYQSGSVAKVRLFRTGRHFEWFSWYEQVDPGFRAELGFIPRSGYRETGAETSYRFETGRETGLLAVSLAGGGNVLNDMERSDRERSIHAGPELQFATGGFRPSVIVGRERFRGERLDTVRGKVAADWAPSEAFGFFFGAQAGDRIAYFAEEPFVGSSALLAGEVGLRPSERLTLTVGGTRTVFSAGNRQDAGRQFFGREGEDTVFDVTVARLASQVFFTQALSLRLIADWSDIDDEVAPSILFGYRPGPGTVVYLGWQDAFPIDSGDAGAEDRHAVFLKLSYLFRAPVRGGATRGTP